MSILSWAFWFFVDVYTAMWLFILTHELGHYAVARWYDLPIARVRLGEGWLLYDTYYHGELWELRAWPRTGAVRIVGSDLNLGDPVRSLLLWSAGPAVGLAYAALVWVVIWLNSGNWLSFIVVWCVYSNFRQATSHAQGSDGFYLRRHWWRALRTGGPWLLDVYDRMQR